MIPPNNNILPLLLREGVGGRGPATPNPTPPCGAKTRTGGRCDAPGMSNGRCRLHGGLSTGPRTPQGRARMLAANTTHGLSTAPKRTLHRYARTLARRTRLTCVAQLLRDYLPPEMAARLAAGPRELWAPPHPSNVPFLQNREPTLRNHPPTQGAPHPAPPPTHNHLAWPPTELPPARRPPSLPPGAKPSPSPEPPSAPPSRRTGPTPPPNRAPPNRAGPHRPAPWPTKPKIQEPTPRSRRNPSLRRPRKPTPPSSGPPLCPAPSSPACRPSSPNASAPRPAASSRRRCRPTTRSPTPPENSRPRRTPSAQSPPRPPDPTRPRTELPHPPAGDAAGHWPLITDHCYRAPCSISPGRRWPSLPR